MLLRHRVQLKTSAYQRIDENERLLSAIELEDYFPVEAITPFGELDASYLNGEYQSCPREALLRKRVRRVGKYVHALIRRPQQHLRSQWTIVQEREELECSDGVKASFEMLSGRTAKGSCHPSRAKSCPGSDATGLRAAVHWYFWSPAETVKNCPTMEFLRIRLAPPSVWL